ncbi:unnamed protein product [Cunninghamella blakesleeana]
MLRKSARLEKLQKKNYSLKSPGSLTKRIIKKPSVNLLNNKRKKKNKPTDNKSIYNEIKLNKILENKMNDKNKIINPVTLTASSSLMLRKYDVQEAWDHIKSVDHKLAKYMSHDIFLDFQKSVLHATESDPFNSLATSIIYQQIHGKAAATIKNRFLRLFEKETPIVFPVEDPLPNTFNFFPSPKMILSISTEKLKSAGLSQRKAEYIQDLARLFNKQSIKIEQLNTMSVEEISELLCSVKGVGQWTVDMFLMFNLRHSNILPVTDLGVRKGIALHFNLESKKDKKKRIVLPSPEEMRRLTAIWNPYRTLGSWLMWKIQDIKILADTD